MDEFVGKVALITGAGQGSGREIALAFSSLGVVVAANDINPINLDETVSKFYELVAMPKLMYLISPSACLLRGC